MAISMDLTFLGTNRTFLLKYILMFDFLLTLMIPSCKMNLFIGVHITAVIWSASFYQAAVNSLTMSESVPRAIDLSEWYRFD